VCAKVNDVSVKVSPLTPAFDVDMKATLATIDHNSKLLFLCSPGNPTSKVIPNAVVEEILGVYSTGVVVVDEAYIDFSGTSSACELIDKYPNVVVLQTLSKAFGLAGIRLGMAIGNEAIIQLMNNVKAPYNVNKLTAEVALSALQNLDLYSSNVKTLLSERDYLREQLSTIAPISKIHPSDANFLLFVIPRALEIYKIMADKGIVCRYRYYDPSIGNDTPAAAPPPPIIDTLRMHLVEGRRCTARTACGSRWALARKTKHFWRY